MMTPAIDWEKAHHCETLFISEVYMVLVIAIAFVLAVAIVTTGIVCLYRYVCLAANIILLTVFETQTIIL